MLVAQTSKLNKAFAGLIVSLGNIVGYIFQMLVVARQKARLKRNLFFFLTSSQC